MSTRVLLVDDHRLMRDGLRAVLEDVEDVEVVGDASDGRTALSLLRDRSPDVVVMDIGMPGMNGIEATRQLRGLDPNVKVIALSVRTDRRSVLEMLESGAKGYVLKICAAEDLVRAIRAVASGKRYLSAEITDVLVDSYVGRSFPTEESGFHVLGAREREVLQLLAEGRRSPEIANTLHVSVKTVEAHRRNIMRKLDLHTVAELTKYAIREGLTSLDS